MLQLCYKKNNLLKKVLRRIIIIPKMKLSHLEKNKFILIQGGKTNYE